MQPWFTSRLGNSWFFFCPLTMWPYCRLTADQALVCDWIAISSQVNLLQSGALLLGLGQLYILIFVKLSVFHFIHQQMENQVVVSDYTQMDRVLREERQYILEICKKIKKAGCNVLLIQKSILRWLAGSFIKKNLVVFCVLFYLGVTFFKIKGQV